LKGEKERFEDRGQGKAVGYLFLAAEMWRCEKDRRRERTEEMGSGKRKEYCAVTSCEAGLVSKAKQGEARYRTEGTVM
jgi:hypothetical protein